MSGNPYASPSYSPVMDSDVAVRPEEMRVASQGKRFLNMLVDSILIHVLSWIAGFVIGVFYAYFKVSTGSVITPEDEAWLSIVGLLVGMLVFVAYFVVTETVFQRTLAKFLTGTIVVTADGRRPPFSQIVGRSFARIIPFEAFSFLGSRQPVGWHDSLSGTRVVVAR